MISNKPCQRTVVLIIVIGLAGVVSMNSALRGAEYTAPLYGDWQSGDTLAESGGALDRLYGWSNLRRVKDSDADRSDQYWQCRPGVLTVYAKGVGNFSRFGWTFGILPESAGTAFQEIFTEDGQMYCFYDDDPATVERPMCPEGSFPCREETRVFRLGLNLRAESLILLRSVEMDNTIIPTDRPELGRDHMVTYEIIGCEGFPGNTVGNFIVAWEDVRIIDAQRGYDDDYLDVIIELSGAQPAPCPRELFSSEDNDLWDWDQQQMTQNLTSMDPVPGTGVNGVQAINAHQGISGWDNTSTSFSVGSPNPHPESSHGRTTLPPRPVPPHGQNPPDYQDPDPGRENPQDDPDFDGDFPDLDDHPNDPTTPAGPVVLEPTSFSLMALAGVFLMRRRRKQNPLK